MESERPGSPSFPSVESVGGSSEDLDNAVRVVSASAARWASTDLRSRIELLDKLLHDCGEIAPEWLSRSSTGKDVVGEPDAVGQEWVSGPYVTLRYIRGLRDSLGKLARYGRIDPPKTYVRHPDDRVIARALPQTLYDRLFFTGLSAEVVMKSGVEAPGLVPSLPQALGEGDGSGSVLVLGAGNVSGMGPVDGLFHLFGRGRTVLLKMNPVNAYMEDVVRRAFRSLIDEGYLQIVQGGPDQGSYLCDHPLVDEIHLTGSDKTYEAVLFGTGAAGSARKARGERLRCKPVTAELGGVGPVIVTPGNWTRRELVQGAELTATIAFDGGGYSCGAIDLMVLPKDWPQIDDFIEAFRSALDRMPLRPDFYPGSRDRYETFVGAHDVVEFHGHTDRNRPQWAFIRGLDDRREDEMCFRQEPFCAVVAETSLPSPSVDAYLGDAVRFVNQRLWGTLGVTLLVPASVARNRSAAQSIERAIADLRYGTIGVNYHPSAAWVSGTTPWGGYQASDIEPAESGVGFTQNAMMLQDTEKTVLRAPLGGPLPAPVWLMGRGEAMCAAFERICAFEADPSMASVPGIMKAGLGW